MTTRTKMMRLRCDSCFACWLPAGVALLLTFSTYFGGRAIADGILESQASPGGATAPGDNVEWVMTVAFSPDGKTLASGSFTPSEREVSGPKVFRIDSFMYGMDKKKGIERGRLRLWDVQTGELLRTVPTGAASIVFSPDGERVVTAAPEAVRFWDVQTDEIRRTLSKNEPWTWAPMTFLPDGETLAFGAHADKGTGVMLWDATNGMRWKEWDLVRYGARVRTRQLTLGPIFFSRDGSVVAITPPDRSVFRTFTFLDMQTGKPLRTISKIRSMATSITISPDGKAFVLLGGKGEIKLFDAEQEARPLDGIDQQTRHPAPGLLRAHSAVFSPDGKTFAIGGAEREGEKEIGVVKLWETETGTSIGIFKEHKKDVLSVAFSPDGNTLASGSADGSVKLWHVQTGEEQRTLNPPTVTRETADSGATAPELVLQFPRRRQSYAPPMAFSRDGKTLAIFMRGEYLGAGMKLWDVKKGRLLRTLNVGSAWPIMFVNASDGTTWAGRGSVGAGEVGLWDLEAETLVWSFKAWKNVSPDPITLSGTIPPPGTIASTYTITAFAVAPDGRTLAIARGEWLDEWGGAGVPTSRGIRSEIILWDTKTNVAQKSLTVEDSFVSSVAFAPDGKTFVAGTNDGTVYIFDTATGRTERTLWTLIAPRASDLRKRTESETLVSLSADGSTIATLIGREPSLDAPSIRLWDAYTGELRLTLNAKELSSIYAIAFAPDGNMLVSIGSDIRGHYMRAWDLTSGELLWMVSRRDVRAPLAFSPDGGTIATAGRERGEGHQLTIAAIKLWDADSGRLLATLVECPKGQDDEVNWIAFTPEGYYAASKGAEKFIRWQIGNDLLPVERYEAVYHRPDLVEQALRVNPLPPTTK